MDMPDWRPVATADVLRLRARMRGRIRAFFAATGALEVDTPVVVRTVPAEARIDPVSTRVAGEARYLRTSPESAMKRLLAAGVGDCWQLGPVFRDHELGRLHQPEFQLLEWYRVGSDHHELMDDVEALIMAALAGECGFPTALRLSYRETFRRIAGVDPLIADTPAIVHAARSAAGSEPPPLAPDDRDGWLDWLLATVVVPGLAGEGPVFVHDWPPSQAALARIDPGPPATARRFELFWRGVELANGYHELGDPVEQRARLEAEAERKPNGFPMDSGLLGALEAGLPECAGVALGFDRLVMLVAGAGRIDDVLAFPADRA